jgi:hypothetical protein
MSTLTKQDLRNKIDELNQMILQGEILEAFDKFYSRDIVMEEEGEKREGWEANREYEEQFVNGLTEFRGADVLAVGVDEENQKTLVEWYFDFTLEGVGDLEFKQVAIQTWDNGKIVNEKFYKLG